MSTDLTIHQPTTEVESHRPDLNAWAQKLAAAHQIGTALCNTSFAPQHFRGKPDEAAAAILYGSEVGFTPTQALQNLFVIGGKPAMYARPMVAIAQAAGHEVWTESKTDDSVTVCGRRKGTENVIRETWTIARAQRAGYTNNKKYQTDPQAMLYARAASDVCRQIAADALAGMTYSVEEMEMVATPAQPAQHVTADTFLKPDADVQDAEVVTEEPTAEQPADFPAAQNRLNAMFAEFGRAGFTTDARSAEGRQARLDYCSNVIGRPVESSKDLLAGEVERVINALKADAADDGELPLDPA